MTSNPCVLYSYYGTCWLIHHPDADSTLQSFSHSAFPTDDNTTKASRLMRISSFTGHANLQQCYKPWDLLPEDEARIKSQIEEAEATVEREAAASTEQAVEVADASSVYNCTDPVKSKTEDQETVGQNTNNEDSVETSQISEGEPQPPVESGNLDLSIPPYLPTDHVDDGGDVVVEGDEDTVIY